NVKTVLFSRTGDCGGVDFRVAFSLSRRNQAPGVIVQEVNREPNPVQCCDGTTIAGLGFFAPNHKHYFEAWNVDENGKITPAGSFTPPGAKAPVVFHDVFLSCDIPNSCGNFSIIGQVAFFENHTTEELLTLKPKSRAWQPGVKPPPGGPCA